MRVRVAGVRRVRGRPDFIVKLVHQASDRVAFVEGWLLGGTVDDWQDRLYNEIDWPRIEESKK